MGSRVSELMTALSAGAEMAEMFKQACSAAQCARLSLPELKKNRKRVDVAEFHQSAEVMAD